MNEKERLEAIKNSLTIKQILQLLDNFDADPQENNGIIMSRTICHNGNSHKLYYYENTKLFRCYTACAEDSFDIFNLIMKIQNIKLPQAVEFIINYFNLTQFAQNGFENHSELQDWNILNNYLRKNAYSNNKKRIVEMKFYNDKILTFLPHPRILDWENEGITNDVIKNHNICYNPSSQAIVIPHYDKDNNLVGIRERTLIKENEIYGKYRPMYLNKQLYNHPLGFNLYNLNNSKENIKALRPRNNL